MKLTGEAQLLRIFLGESDLIHHHPVWERLLTEAKAQHLAGCTVWKCQAGFGANSRIHTNKLVEFSSDLPVVVEIVDTEEKISAFLPFVDQVFEDAECGGLVTLEKAQVRMYKPGKTPL